MKKNIKQIIISITALLVFVNITGCGLMPESKPLLQAIKDRGYIKAGVKYDSKPFGFIDQDQQIKGFDIDLIKEISRRILGDADSVKFQQVTSSNRIPSITSGSVDLVAATMTINNKRKRIVDFSDPYYMAGQAIMIPKTSGIKTMENLNGKRVSVVLGSTSEQNLSTLAPKAIPVGFKTYTDAFSALRAHRTDALTTDDTIIAGFLAEDNNFKMLPNRYTQEPYGIAFKKGKGSRELKELVNITLEEMQSDGTLDRIRKKWMVNYIKK
ncbi:MAG: transporter substrate-binding domain-containing protein [bacterium]